MASKKQPRLTAGCLVDGSEHMFRSAQQMGGDLYDPDQAVSCFGSIDRIFLNTTHPVIMTAPASTINPTGNVANDVVTVAQSMHTAAESKVT